MTLFLFLFTLFQFGRVKLWRVALIFNIFPTQPLLCLLCESEAVKVTSLSRHKDKTDVLRTRPLPIQPGSPRQCVRQRRRRPRQSLGDCEAETFRRRLAVKKKSCVSPSG